MEVERRGFSVIPGVGGHGSADPFTKTRSCTITTWRGTISLSRKGLS